MKMVTFGVNDGEELIVAFPVFVQDHTRESMTLYELKTVKVPITDTNLAANSYIWKSRPPSLIKHLIMTITFNCALPNCACVSKFGTAITVKNCFWLSISLNTAVKVQSIIIFLRKLLMTIVLLSTSITLL